MRLNASRQRERIDEILASALTLPQWSAVWDRLVEVPGIEIVERRDPFTEMMLKKDCASYVAEKLGITYQDLFMITHTNRRVRGYREIPKLQPGALVAYYTPSNDLTQRHFGIGENAETVISKWSIGHVFRHPLHLVGAMYTEARFFTDSRL
jgi:hypothetical protein